MASNGRMLAVARKGVWPRGAKSSGVSERRRGRAYQACACVHQAGQAGRSGEGAPAAAEEVSLFPRSGRCVAARVATREVGRDRGAEPLRLPSSRALKPQSPARVADPGEARSPCGPGPPAALQVGASGLLVPAPRRGPALSWCYPGDDLVPGVPVLARDASPVLASVPVEPGPGRADLFGAGPLFRCSPALGRRYASSRTAPPHPDRVCGGPAGSGEVLPVNSGQVRDHLDLSTCCMGSWTSRGDLDECLGYLWPVLKVGSSGVGSFGVAGGMVCDVTSQIGTLIMSPGR